MGGFFSCSVCFVSLRHGRKKISHPPLRTQGAHLNGIVRHFEEKCPPNSIAKIKNKKKIKYFFLILILIADFKRTTSAS